MVLIRTDCFNGLKYILTSKENMQIKIIFQNCKQIITLVLLLYNYAPDLNPEYYSSCWFKMFTVYRIF
jgi:hypothetical protein